MSRAKCPDTKHVPTAHNVLNMLQSDFSGNLHLKATHDARSGVVWTHVTGSYYVTCHVDLIFDLKFTMSAPGTQRQTTVTVTTTTTTTRTTTKTQTPFTSLKLPPTNVEANNVPPSNSENSELCRKSHTTTHTSISLYSSDPDDLKEPLHYETVDGFYAVTTGQTTGIFFSLYVSQSFIHFMTIVISNIKLQSGCKFQWTCVPKIQNLASCLPCLHTYIFQGQGPYHTRQ